MPHYCLHTIISVGSDKEPRIQFLTTFCCCNKYFQHEFSNWSGLLAAHRLFRNKKNHRLIPLWAWKGDPSLSSPVLASWWFWKRRVYGCLPPRPTSEWGLDQTTKMTGYNWFHYRNSKNNSLSYYVKKGNAYNDIYSFLWYICLCGTKCVSEHYLITSSIRFLASLEIQRGKWGVSDLMDSNSSSSSSPWKGDWPISISYTSTPNDHQSTEKVYFCPNRIYDRRQIQEM